MRSQRPPYLAPKSRAKGKRAQALADREWTEAERLEAQELVRAMGILQSGVVQDQRRLKATAEAILTHLRD